MKNPKITIIMAVYNTEKYLDDAIKSILNQTFSDFEFIIIDDCSTDDSKKIIMKYSHIDNRIKSIDNSFNMGVGKVRNMGLSIAKGKYIAIMDSDDISLNNRLEIEYNYLEYNKEIFLVAGSYEYIDSSNNLINKKILNYDFVEIKKSIPKQNLIHQPTVMFRNQKNIFYREKILFGEDRDLWLRFATEGKKMVVISDILLQYRIHETSVTNSKKIQQKKMIKLINNWYYERLKYGNDSYHEFNLDIFIENNNYNNKLKEIALVESRELKFNFKNNESMTQIRKLIFNYWEKHGLLTWKSSIVYYISTFIKPLRAMLKKRL